MRVTLNAQQIQRFKNTWPCNGIPELDQITFEFASNGDLVDIEAYRDGEYVDTEHFDGSAMVALSHDVQNGTR